MLHAVIMAGGSGTRFWPASRRALPKQFLPLAGDRSLLQQAVVRCQPLIPAERIWIVTNELHLAETRKQLPDIAPEHILCEPCGRNTAPCIGLAAVRLLHDDPHATMLVMPSDHVIRTDEVFRNVVKAAADFIAHKPAASVLFGVPPSYPATGFGYIERGAALDDKTAGAFHVQSFREKPSREVAQEFVAAGRYYWNCGIFLWRAERIRQWLAAFQPEIHSRLEKLAVAVGTPTWELMLRVEFPSMPSISIDHGVLEKAEDIFVWEAPFAWDDVGSWQALPRLLSTDTEENTVDGLFCGLETRGCIIRSTPDHLVATVGLEDCIVVHTHDATLIARKDDEQALRRLVALLEERGHVRFL